MKSKDDPWSYDPNQMFDPTRYGYGVTAANIINIETPEKQFIKWKNTSFLTEYYWKVGPFVCAPRKD